MGYGCKASSSFLKRDYSCHMCHEDTEAEWSKETVKKVQQLAVAPNFNPGGHCSRLEELSGQAGL